MPLLARATAIADDRDAGRIGASGAAARLCSRRRSPQGPTRQLPSRASCAQGSRRWRRCGTRARPPLARRHAARQLRAPPRRAAAGSARASYAPRRRRWRDLLVGERGSTPADAFPSARSVAYTLAEVARTALVSVACGEGRPRFEGRRLAQHLHAAGIDVRLVVDAALTGLLPQATAIVLGADAISAAALDQQGRHIRPGGGRARTAGRGLRDRIARQVRATRAGASHPVATDLPMRFGRKAGGHSRRNFYFEATPVDLATLYLSDSGAIRPPTCRPRSSAAPRKWRFSRALAAQEL